MKEFVERCRKWQKENPDWELICDINDTDYLYVQWSELPKSARMSWVGSYGTEAREMFEEYGRKPCKVDCMVLDNDMRLHDLKDWPQGHTMTVFRTSLDGVNLVGC